MKSPFPGMDPYLEKYWHEVHQRLVIYTGDSLRSLLPHTLKADDAKLADEWLRSKGLR